MRDPLLDKSAASRAPSPSAGPLPSKIDPVQLAQWLAEHGDRLGDRWLTGVAGRHETMDDEVAGLLSEFFRVFTRFLPVFLGPYREQVESLWTRLAELYGSVSAMRGLAAGEVIEEFQLLREEIIRLFYDVPPVRNLDRLALRDVLRVNRIVDLGVTHASIGHTDALFFALFQGSGVANSLSEQQEEEVWDQLEGISDELDEVIELLER